MCPQYWYGAKSIPRVKKFFLCTICIINDNDIIVPRVITKGLNTRYVGTGGSLIYLLLVQYPPMFILVVDGVVGMRYIFSVFKTFMHPVPRETLRKPSLKTTIYGLHKMLFHVGFAPTTLGGCLNH